MGKYRTGFIIVELLIVIVVIAILASITIVAYNGIQQRANNTSMVSAAATYNKALRLYAATNNVYPTFGVYAVCLGDGYPSDHCWIGPNGDYYALASFDTELQAYISTKPTVNAKYYAVTAQDSRSGIIYYRNSPVGRQSMEYQLDGANQNCGLNGAIASNTAGNTATKCYLTFPVP